MSCRCKHKKRKSKSSVKPIVWQQLTKLIGSGYVGTPNQGSIGQISGDGKTIAIGGFNDNGLIGAVWIFVKKCGKWYQQGNKLVGTTNQGPSAFGTSLALSDDGNVLAVGGSADNGGVGAVWIFVRNCGVWSQQGGKLIGTGYVGTSFQGANNCVALSADGKILAVGGEGDNGGVGAVWIFINVNGFWLQQGGKLVANDYAGASLQGALALNSQGTILAVGGEGDNGGVGAAWIYTRFIETWTQYGSKLVGTGYVGTSNQGRSVELNAKGDILAVGGWHDNGGIGAAWMFQNKCNGYVQVGEKLVGTDGVGTPFEGWFSSVALSASGDIVTVGGPNDNSAVGAVWTYERLSGKCDKKQNLWTQQGNKLLASGTIGVTNQGSMTSLSNSGKILIVGAPNDNSSVGAVFVFIAKTAKNCS